MTDAPWHAQLKAYPIDWLLEESDPGVRLGALVHLLDRPPHRTDVVAAQRALQHSAPVQALLADQHPGGYWGDPGNYLRWYTGTVWRWLLLLEMGLDPKHDAVQRAAHHIVDAAYHPDRHAFCSHPGHNPVLCYTGTFLWGLLRSGLADHPHVSRALDWMTLTMRYRDGDESAPDPDNGCLGRHTCYRAVVPLLRALAVLPPRLQTQRTRTALTDGVEFVLVHHVYKRSHDLAKPLNARLTQLTFPSIYWPDFIEVLLVLTDLGVTDPRMDDALAYLRRKQRKDGTWKLQRLFNDRGGGRIGPCPVSFGDRGEPNKWTTLRALTVLRRTLSSSTTHTEESAQ